MIVGYALPSVAGGNGYLSVYLCGILIGNRFIPDKKEMVHFFDILTEIAQMVIFFLLDVYKRQVKSLLNLVIKFLCSLYYTIYGEN